MFRKNLTLPGGWLVSLIQRLVGAGQPSTRVPAIGLGQSITDSPRPFEIHYVWDCELLFYSLFNKRNEA